MKVLIDTNIVVDNLACRDECEDSLNILNFCESGRLEGVVSIITIMNVMHVLRKHLSSPKARGAVLIFMQTVDIIPAHKSDINAALISNFSDFDDAVQAACAARVKADYIVTRNVKDFKNSLVQAILPVDMLKLLQDL